MDAMNPDLRRIFQPVQDRFPAYVEASSKPPFSVSVTPAAEASPMYVTDLGEEFVFGVGRGGCRWELGTSPEDLEFLRRVSDAVILGNVSEVFGPGRSRVRVHLQDGTVVQTSSADVPRGCLPVPFWTRRRSRTVTYAAY